MSHVLQTLEPRGLFIVPNLTFVNYSSSLRTKEENFDNVGFESSKLAVVNHEQGSKDSDSV